MSKIAGSSEHSFRQLGRDVRGIGRYFRLLLGIGISGYILYKAAQMSLLGEVTELGFILARR